VWTCDAVSHMTTPTRRMCSRMSKYSYTHSYNILFNCQKPSCPLHFNSKGEWWTSSLIFHQMQ